MTPASMRLWAAIFVLFGALVLQSVYAVGMSRTRTLEIERIEKAVTQCNAQVRDLKGEFEKKLGGP